MSDYVITKKKLTKAEMKKRGLKYDGWGKKPGSKKTDYYYEKVCTMTKRDVDIIKKEADKKLRPKGKYRVFTVRGKPRTLLWTNSKRKALKRADSYADKTNKPCGYVKYGRKYNIWKKKG